MSLVRFDALPDDARLWCFGADRPLDPAATARLLDDLGTFLEAWTSHRQELAAGFELRHQRFLLVAVDESRAGTSGCSIDALVRHLQELELALGVRLTDAAPIWYRDREGAIRTAERAEFRRLAAKGRVGEETPVFDLTRTRLSDLRSGEWERPAGRSWHARLLGAAAGSGGGGARR